MSPETGVEAINARKRGSKWGTICTFPDYLLLSEPCDCRDPAQRPHCASIAAETGLSSRHDVAVVCGRLVRTTVSDVDAACPLDKVNWHFRAERPNQFRVSDFTCA